MPDLKDYPSAEINWSLDFSPRNDLPDFMPTVILAHNGQLTAVAGFGKKNQPVITCLKIQESLSSAMGALHPEAGLRPLEALRRSHALKALRGDFDFLLSLPLDLQNYFDDHNLSIKTLKPLAYLSEWLGELTAVFFSLKLTSSQAREVIDILCDLKGLNFSWDQVKPSSEKSELWIYTLKKLRAPKALSLDEMAKNQVQKISWPRGVAAKWERWGDQSGILIQTKVTNSKEWKAFRENLPQISEEFWNS